MAPLKRASQDTGVAFDWSWSAIIRSIVVPLAFVIFVFFVRGKDAAMLEAIDILLFTFAFLGVSIVPIFLWNLWLAPYKILEEQIELLGEQLYSAREAKPSEKADVWDYTKHTNFLLYEAACLWAGLEPHRPIVDKKARAKLSQLKSAIRCGDLLCVWGNTWSKLIDALNGSDVRSPSDTQRVSVVELRRYAEKKYDVPDFLQHVQVPKALPAAQEATANLPSPSEQ